MELNCNVHPLEAVEDYESISMKDTLLVSMENYAKEGDIRLFKTFLREEGFKMALIP